MVPGHRPQSSCGPQALREAVGAPPPKGEGGRRSYAVAQTQAEAHKAAATLQQAVRASKVAVPVAAEFDTPDAVITGLSNVNEASADPTTCWTTT